MESRLLVNFSMLDTALACHCRLEGAEGGFIFFFLAYDF